MVNDAGSLHQTVHTAAVTLQEPHFSALRYCVVFLRENQHYCSSEVLQQAYVTGSETCMSYLQAWFYELQAGEGALLAEHDYLGSVESMQLNGQWAAALFEGEPLDQKRKDYTFWH